MSPERTRCPRCDRELREHRVVGMGMVRYCVGCEKAPAYCNCPPVPPGPDQGLIGYELEDWGKVLREKGAVE